MKLRYGQRLLDTASGIEYTVQKYWETDSSPATSHKVRLHPVPESLSGSQPFYVGDLISLIKKGSFYRQDPQDRAPYKAQVFGRPVSIDGQVLHPAFETAEGSQEDVLAYCEKLIEAGSIVAYRLVYALGGDGDRRWYNSEHVVYLPEGAKTFKVG